MVPCSLEAMFLEQKVYIGNIPNQFSISRAKAMKPSILERQPKNNLILTSFTTEQCHFGSGGISFTVQGQICRHPGSLHPNPIEESDFTQI
ncbi:hypothetical protein AVEN_139661-1 [Araneus ventricosus]|uniref:Uncharacterized protein n=1 Tax=Araneus ventricosus TaxID=182803 RepID=A0A4Y1ZZT4_ARAVE|nr:hypothetical protein AVEN_139661-1 [Araneus ventricosus]